jgi:hypothetical protein
VVLGHNCYHYCSASNCESSSHFSGSYSRVALEIGVLPFSHSGIKIIRIPSKVENIGEDCFYQFKSLCEFIFESDSKLKEIGDSVFLRSGIRAIRIPSNVEDIGKYCFSGCESFSEITFALLVLERECLMNVH